MKTLVLYDIDGETLTDLGNIQNGLAAKYEKPVIETFVGPYDMFTCELSYYGHPLGEKGRLELLEWYDDCETVKYISKILDILSDCDALLLPKDFAFDHVYRIVYHIAKEFGYRIDAIDSDGKRICLNLPD